MAKEKYKQRSDEEIRKLYLNDLISTVSQAAMTFYGEDSNNKRSVLGAYEGAITKTAILPFRRICPGVAEVEIPWQYHATRTLGQEKLLLKIGVNIFHLTGAIPKKGQIDEIWSIELGEMIKGGRKFDSIFVT